LRLSYSHQGNKTAHKAFYQFLNNIDTFPELAGYSVIYDTSDGSKATKVSKSMMVRADRIEWSSRSYWDDLAERRKFLIVIDQTSSRSTEWTCHNRVYCVHDFRNTIQYTAVSQAQERVDHYSQNYGDVFQPIKVYGHLPTFQLSAGVITYDEYFQNEWERRKIDSRISGDVDLYIVRARVGKARHAECPEDGMNNEDSTRLLQRLGCGSDTSISSRVAGKPKQVPEYEAVWKKGTSETWQSVWNEYCAECDQNELPIMTRSNVRNPYSSAAIEKKQKEGLCLWRGQHRGWRALRWNLTTKQLFDIDVAGEEPTRIHDLGSTGGERNKICYNEVGELGFLIVRPTGKQVTKNKLVSVNTMYLSN
jgi:hypothetical protein